MLLKRTRPEGPSLTLDLYGRDALLNPQATYRRIRDAGGVVWLPKHRMWVMGRYQHVRDALRDDDTFRSGKGVGANWLVNLLSQGTTLTSDGQPHIARRRVLSRSLSVKALCAVDRTLQQEALVVTRRLLNLASFDGVSDFAAHLPVRVVADLVGVDVAVTRMRSWARSSFDGLGPINRRALAALPPGVGLWRYAHSLRPHDVKTGKWAASVLAGYDSALSLAERQAMVIDFIAPSIDTTILASAQMLWSLGSNPDVWQELRENPDLVPAAAVEAVRLASPVRGFTRIVQRDNEIDGSVLRAGQRVVLLYASANTDETYFEQPEVFSLHRTETNLGFGFGAHACAGMHLTKLELHALLRAMIPAVSQISVSEPVPLLNNTLQGFASFRAAFRN
jgi:cytochrome P450